MQLFRSSKYYSLNISISRFIKKKNISYIICRFKISMHSKTVVKNIHVVHCRVRVANELGAGNGKAAKFATMVSVATSTAIGVVGMVIVLVFHEPIALLFSSSRPVLDSVNTMTLLLALTILLNSVQPVLSGNFICFYIFKRVIKMHIMKKFLHKI